MASTTTLPSLPAELLLEIFLHLPHEDTRTFLRINSHFRRIAQPYAYRYGTMTKFGLHFPGAAHPYPFCDDPNPEALKITEKKREWIASQLERIDVVPHSELDCASPPPHILCPSVLNVLRLDWHISSDPGFCIPENGSGCMHEYSINFGGCAFLNTVLQNCPQGYREVIARGVPRPDGSGAMYPENYPVTTGRHVSVLCSQPPSVPRTSDCLTQPDLETFDVSGRQCGEHLEVIFWTSRPGQAWIPPCEFYVNGDMLNANVCHPRGETVWSRLFDIAYFHRLKKVTVVNATAIVPPGSTPDEHEARLSRGEVNMRDNEDLFIANAEKQKEWLDNPITATFEFIAMEQWIRRNTWGDVFTYAELDPWLTAMREET
ncbi:hypothetical protein A1Q2_00847 [Trichosporon asahii var. asahii CBS 8904]|uniref:F-box domain-containing protein n=1 Tax=Trichosporon asahii var. asahii (strain CBS 8904) TaxID=1220162 RepID=K1VWH4_TRIAC|nr:hypothetical protein A1Q2_00847 [Trichosporon asahii var. asahii CBS 8904]